MILDFETLVYTSGAGLRAGLITAKNLWKRNVPFAVCSPLGVVRRVWEAFQMSGFAKIVSIHGFREHAFAAVDE